MTAVDCPSCADERAAGAAFCEACGNALRDADPPAAATGAASCAHCGAAASIGPDGYCGQCGMLAGRPTDHVEFDLGVAGAAVTDRGRRHFRNEDAVWLTGADAGVDVVVCDGVSASFDPDVAAALAAETAGKQLAVPGGDDPPELIARAITAAADAVAALATAADPRRVASPPACTIVAARVRGADVGYGWIGDSRAYWLPGDGPAEQLTEDDSWATQAIAMGADPRAAMLDPQSHAITAWLGADSLSSTPRTGQFRAGTAGHLVLCSDGLWNYLADPVAFAGTVRDHLRDAAGNPLAAARSLAAYANSCGGADNVTVALIPVVATVS